MHYKGTIRRRCRKKSSASGGVICPARRVHRSMLLRNEIGDIFRPYLGNRSWGCHLEIDFRLSPFEFHWRISVVRNLFHHSILWCTNSVFCGVESPGYYPKLLWSRHLWCRRISLDVLFLYMLQVFTYLQNHKPFDALEMYNEMFKKEEFHPEWSHSSSSWSDSIHIVTQRSAKYLPSSSWKWVRELLILKNIFLYPESNLIEYFLWCTLVFRIHKLFSRKIAHPTLSCWNDRRHESPNM